MTVLPAEEGCLQYFTGVSGQIKSYNYDPGAGLQLSKQDYSICIRTERNFCGIQYASCPDSGRIWIINHSINCLMFWDSNSANMKAWYWYYQTYQNFQNPFQRNMST